MADDDRGHQCPEPSWWICERGRRRDTEEDDDEDEDEDEHIRAALIAVALAVGVAVATTSQAYARAVRRPIYEPRRLSWEEHEADLKERSCFRRYYRMEKESFHKLTELLRPLLERNAYYGSECKVVQGCSFCDHDTAVTADSSN